MSTMLASDLNNPDFAGPVNPDSRLAVRFYVQAFPNNFMSEKEGRPIFQDVDMIQIMVPGDATSIIDTPVREEHKKRWPIQWAHFQNKHGGDPREIGTPLEQWPRLNKSQVEELKALKIYTVENVAGMSDANLQKIGMIAGMQPHAFRDHAVRFLRLAHDDSIANEAETRAKALEEANAKLKADTDAQLAEMREQLAALAVQKPAPKKRGRPRKVVVE